MVVFEMHGGGANIFGNDRKTDTQTHKDSGAHLEDIIEQTI